MTPYLRLIAMLLFGLVVAGPIGLFVVALIWAIVQMYTTGRLSK